MRGAWLETAHLVATAAAGCQQVVLQYTVYLDTEWIDRRLRSCAMEIVQSDSTKSMGIQCQVEIVDHSILMHEAEFPPTPPTSGLRFM